MTLDSDQLERIAYDYYRDLHENPRPIAYAELAEQVDGDIQLADFVADCVSLACTDAEQNRDARSKRDVIETVLGWSD